MAFDKSKEKELKEIESVKAGYKTRIIQTDKENVVDIREYIESDKFTGYTKKGIRFNKEQAQKAIEVLSKALELI